MPYGLVDIRIENVTSTASFTVNLPEPAPAGAAWFKCSEYIGGCIDFSRDYISGGTGDGAEFNDTRTAVTVYLTDNGEYDDNDTYGIVRDPSGLGYECGNTPDCDDGLFCNGQETCRDGACLNGPEPCGAGYACDEHTEACVAVYAAPPAAPSGGGGGRPHTTTVEPAVSATAPPETTTTTAEEPVPEIDYDTTTSTSITEDTSSASTTTTAPPPAPGDDETQAATSAALCIFDWLFPQQPQLQAIRAFRDNHLSKSRAGLAIINMYYQHSAEIIQLLTVQPQLSLRVQTLTLEMLPQLDRDGSVTITASQRSAVEGILEQLKQHASGQLRRSIERCMSSIGNVVDVQTVQ